MDGKVVLSQFGDIVKTEWLKTFDIRKSLELDEYIIMPNYFHGIITIIDCSRGTLQRAPTFEQFGNPVSNSIPTLIRSFKSTTTKQINELRQTLRMPVWQRSYYEHIIRNEDDMSCIRECIISNRTQWEEDENNQVNVEEQS